MDRRTFLRILGLTPLGMRLSIAEGETPTETLARWHNTINGWEWPDDLPSKPEGFDEMPYYFLRDDPRRYTEPCKFTASWLVAKRIEGIIGEKECLRWHHLHNLGRTNEQFEKWWRSR